MFDISWSEFLLIGVVALVVIGPKELPTVMRTLGQWTRKVRSMASDFQGQFHDAMREFEMADLKQQVDDIKNEVTNFDPLKSTREDLESTADDVKRSLDAAPEPALPAAEVEPAVAELPDEFAAELPAEELPPETPPVAYEATAISAAEGVAAEGVAAEPQVDAETEIAAAGAPHALIEQPVSALEPAGSEPVVSAAEAAGQTAHQATEAEGTGRTG
jgi:sec-independent protein translocase protein TatB